MRFNPNFISPADIVNVRPEAGGDQTELVSNHRNLTVSLRRDAADVLPSTILVSHGRKRDAVTMVLNRTIRVPDNNDTSLLPPSLGHFPLFKIADYAEKLPQDLTSKGGIFFPMYQREAMWISFSAEAPFALKMYVGGVNAVSGFPMTENDKTREKREKMLSSGKSIQDYLVLPEQPWLDGIVTEDGKIRQFVAEPKGNGFSVEAQVTGEEKVGGIQIEIIPIKRHFPAQFDVRYEDKEQKVIVRTFNLAEKGLTRDSTWEDVRERVRDEFDIPMEEQVLCNYNVNPTGKSPFEPDMHFIHDVQLGDDYFPPRPFTLGVEHRPFRPNVRSFARGRAAFTTMSASAASPMAAAVSDVESAPAPASVKEMGLAAGGLITQDIIPDPHPADVWDVEASVMLNISILDTDSFAAVTGQPAPNTPVSAKDYAQHGWPFFELWGKESGGIKGEFKEVKSVAQLMREKAEAEGREFTEEETVAFRVARIGPFRSTFRPVPIMCQHIGLR